MANNRLYIRCLNCGELVFVSKNFGMPWQIFESDLPRLNKFFEEHAWCGGKDSLTHADGGDFELVDEWDAERKQALKEK